MKSICFNCQWRSQMLINQWNEQPAFVCKNPDSFRGKNGQRVTKGMTCSKFEKEQEAA